MPSSSLLGLERGNPVQPESVTALGWSAFFYSPGRASEGKKEMICLAKEEKQSKQNKPSLEVGGQHRRVCWLSVWSLRTD